MNDKCEGYRAVAPRGLLYWSHGIKTNRFLCLTSNLSSFSLLFSRKEAMGGSIPATPLQK